MRSDSNSNDTHDTAAVQQHRRRRRAHPMIGVVAAAAAAVFGGAETGGAQAFAPHPLPNPKHTGSSSSTARASSSSTPSSTHFASIPTAAATPTHHRHRRPTNRWIPSMEHANTDEEHFVASQSQLSSCLQHSQTSHFHPFSPPPPTQPQHCSSTTAATAAAAPSNGGASWFQESGFFPVVSAACLITGNTVGAGCLVLPEVAAGPGLASMTAMLCLAWGLNLVSGLVLAEVALVQHEHQQEQRDQSSYDETTAPPTSFLDFAIDNLGSPVAATAVSGLSLFVNACVLAFDISRVGAVVGASLSLPVLMLPFDLPAELLSPLFHSWSVAGTVSVAWAAAVAAALTGLSTHHVSMVCNLCVAALFVTFGSLLLPGLATAAAVVPPTATAGVADFATSVLSSTTFDFFPEGWVVASAHAFPIVLMSLVFQNIVPVVVKLLDYDRKKTVAALGLGSFIPMLMYTAWCYACLGGGIDCATNGCTTTAAAAAATTTGMLWTAFSMATLGGSSLCTGMSMAEEIETVLASVAGPKEHVPHQEEQLMPPAAISAADSPLESTSSSGCSMPAAVAAISIPLAAALLFGDGETGLTSALYLAGSFGSPILYGVVPAIMAYRQRQGQQTESLPSSSRMPKNATPEYLVSSSTLPVLGFLSTAFVGQEVVTCMGNLFAFAT